jgi:hypothetical protein
MGGSSLLESSLSSGECSCFLFSRVNCYPSELLKALYMEAL